MADTIMPEALQAGLAQRYVSAASYILVVYDIVITLDDEINLIWKAPWSCAKGLFLVNRYYVPMSLLVHQYMMAGFASPKSDNFCARYLLGLETVEIISGAGIISVMLVLRVHALYQRNWRVLVCLLLLACVPLVVNITLAAVAIAQNHQGIIFVPILNTCAVVLKPSYLWLLWVTQAVFETIVFFMIVAKTWTPSMGTLTPLLTILLRDGVVYFAVMTILEVCGIVTYIVLPVDWYFIGTYIIWALHALLVSRIYLNLRNVNNHRDWTNVTNLKESIAPVEAQQRGAALRHEQERFAFDVARLDEYELEDVGQTNSGVEGWLDDHDC